jgi:hypothetical protein
MSVQSVSKVHAFEKVGIYEYMDLNWSRLITDKSLKYVERSIF